MNPKHPRERAGHLRLRWLPPLVALATVIGLCSAGSPAEATLRPRHPGDHQVGAPRTAWRPAAGTPAPANRSIPVSNVAGNQNPTQLTDVLVTGYSYWDNTPPGSTVISHPVIHTVAGGTGSFGDPITTAVGYDANGLWLPAGTRLYIPALKRYFLVEDTCGDGGPSTCPDGVANHLDVWVDGSGSNPDSVTTCLANLTKPYTVVLRPRSDLEVTPGSLC